MAIVTSKLVVITEGKSHENPIKPSFSYGFPMVYPVHEQRHACHSSGDVHLGDEMSTISGPFFSTWLVGIVHDFLYRNSVILGIHIHTYIHICKSLSFSI